ncbi:kinase-like protein, partial [Aureobasidium melanogenum]
MRLFEHKCGVPAEPLDRYEPGGYHPVRLHDVFAGGRYKVISKLGHGSFSTTWIARDSMLSRNVALRITVAEASSPNNRERRVLQALSESKSTLQSDRMHIMQLLDSFQHNGPNGVHDCLVFELLGPNFASVVEKQCTSDRLPGHVARKACKELGLALAVLHRQEIGHGDIHTGNLALHVPGLDTLSENKLFEIYGVPKTGPVTCADGGLLRSGVPDYLVWSASFPASGFNLEESSVKLIDFGESFFSNEKSKALHTPLALRAPEVLFDEEYDFRVDRWSFACAIFELIVGYPPFTGIMAKKEDILQQIADMIGTPPEKWQPKWKAMPKWDQVYDEDPVYDLEQWLDQTYFDDGKRIDFTREDIKQVGRMIRGLLQWCPSDRSSVTEVLANEWFRDC